MQRKYFLDKKTEKKSFLPHDFFSLGTIMFFCCKKKISLQEKKILREEKNVYHCIRKIFF